MKAPATNRDRLIEQSVLGEVTPPRVGNAYQWRVGPDGVPRLLPGVGGITYNLKVGHSALDWEADHVEPGVSIRAQNEEANTALNLLACVGNVAAVVSGDAKGAQGVVTGKHGGVEHVLVDFPQDALDRLVIGDKVQVRARGLGLRLSDLPGVALLNMDPDLFEALGVEEEQGRLKVPVTYCLPAALMGSGIGRAHALSGDYDIQLFDDETVSHYSLSDLRIGDIVAVLDQDHTYGRVYRSGAVSIGVVVHSSCVQAGHGPGLTSLMSSSEGLIVPVTDREANIGTRLRIGTARATS